MKIYLLLYQDNDYNQPEESFLEAYTDYPTKEKVEEVVN